MRPETTLLGVTTVRGGGGATHRTRDREQGRGLGGLFNTLLSSQILLLTLPFYYRGYETRIQGDLYIYEFRGQPSLGGHQVNYCHSYYSCNVPQDRVMGGRECRDFISL